MLVYWVSDYQAFTVVGLVKRSFQFMDKDMFIKLYKCMFRPHLEDANVIWHPIYKNHLIAVEKVQRRATQILHRL